jgi:hypothetical protein
LSAGFSPDTLMTALMMSCLIEDILNWNWELGD